VGAWQRHDGVVPTSLRRSHPDPLRRLKLALAMLVGVLLIGTLGYRLLGIPWLDATYQTVTTVTTIGFREVVPFDDRPDLKIFTMMLALVGVGVALYTLTLLLESVLEGQVGNAWGRRRMQRQIAGLDGHAIICGYGRVGRATAHELTRQGQRVVVIDSDPERFVDVPYPALVADATRDEVLREAGVDRARTLVATLDNDAASLYVVLTAAALNPAVRVIARARTDEAAEKMLRAGADRVVNPQRLGGNRIAAFATQPDVVDFLDVVMHEGTLEFRMEDVTVHVGAPLDGSTVAQWRAREGETPLLLALRQREGEFVTNPAQGTVIREGDVLIAVGTAAQLDDLHRAAGGTP
jgi:voltage-gated potassium channel